MKNKKLRKEKSYKDVIVTENGDEYVCIDRKHGLYAHKEGLMGLYANNKDGLLKAENERLREALKRIASYSPMWKNDQWAKHIAEQALSETGTLSDMTL